MIIEVENGFLVKVPSDIKFEIGVDEDKQMKEITLPKQGNYKINKRIPKKLSHLIDSGKWFLLIKN